MYSTMLASINLFPVLPLSGLYFEQFKQRQETARLALGQMGDYTGKILNIAGIILSTSVFLFFK